MDVRKRDKTLEKFDFEKIRRAIQHAFDSRKEEMPSAIMECVYSMYDEEDDRIIDVEEIQDNVERCLMSHTPDVAREYIIYRYEHKQIRETNNRLIKGIEEKLMAKSIENQNANVDEASFGGRIGEAARFVTKNYAIDYVMSRKAKRNHLNNIIYIHDLDSYAVGQHNCLTLPMDDLLKNGFKTRQSDVRPANSVNTAFQLVAVLFQLQSLQQFGGVAASHIDWTMVPYVRKSFHKHYKNGMKYLMGVKFEDTNKERSIVDEFYKENKGVYEYALDMTKNEIDQAVEGMYHNLN